MYPEDRVLVTYMPDPADLQIAEREGWYRLPEKHAPKGLHAEYFAFYFGRNFGERKWAIHCYARQQGYELVRRRDLFPDYPDHPRAAELYYKVSLGPLQWLDEPIISLRWRRITFMHTTWDRFQDAREINDLFIEGGEYVDRLYATLKERGIQAERNLSVKEGGSEYIVPLSVFTSEGRIDLREEDLPGDDRALNAIVEKLSQQVQPPGRPSNPGESST